MQYSNPRMRVVIEDWPYGRDMTTTATFTIEVHPTRGERAARTTVDPTTGRISAPHRLTYAHSACFVDGDDGKLYILEDTGTHYSIMKSTMAHQHETVFSQDAEQYAALTFLFNQLDQQRTTEEHTMPVEQTDQPTETVKIVSKKVRVRKMATAQPVEAATRELAIQAMATVAEASDGYVPPAALATEAELDAIFGQEAPTALVEPEAQALPALETCPHEKVMRRMDRMFPYRCLQCDTQLTAGALPNVVIVQPEDPAEADAQAHDEAEAQAQLDELPEPQDTIREMTVDTDNRLAYRAEIANNAEDGTRMVSTWTSAPKDFDSFGTQTVEANLGVYCGRTMRQVETPIKHLTWQRERYGSGLHTVATKAQWQEIQVSPGYARENGQNLLAIVDTQPLAQALETLKAQEAAGTVSEPTPEVPSVTGDKQVLYLMALVAEGADAIAAALRSGAVKVRLPQDGRPAKAPQPAHTSQRTGRPSYAQILQGLADDVRTAMLADRDAGLSHEKIDRKHGFCTEMDTKGRVSWLLCKSAG